MKLELAGKFAEIKKFFDDLNVPNKGNLQEADVNIVINELSEKSIELLLKIELEPKKQIAENTVENKKSKGSSSFWAKLTPKERSKEMRRRMRVAAKNKNKSKAVKKEVVKKEVKKKKVSPRKEKALEKARAALALKKQKEKELHQQQIEREADKILSRYPSNEELQKTEQQAEEKLA